MIAALPRLGRWAVSRLVICIALCVGAANALAAEDSPSAPTTPASPRYRLDRAQIEAAPVSSRYRVKARIAPLDSAGELRESPHYVLIGRFAKAAQSCGTDGTIFRNGFEG